MANDTDAAPALTPEEWRDWQAYRDGYWLKLDHDRDIVLVESDGDRLLVDTTPAIATALAAIANAALPDDDPRKIRREDVESLAALLNAPFVLDEGYARDIQRIAAKLAALLPPEH